MLLRGDKAALVRAAARAPSRLAAAVRRRAVITVAQAAARLEAERPLRWKHRLSDWKVAGTGWKHRLMSSRVDKSRLNKESLK